MGSPMRKEGRSRDRGGDGRRQVPRGGAFFDFYTSGNAPLFHGREVRIAPFHHGHGPPGLAAALKTHEARMMDETKRKGIQ